MIDEFRREEKERSLRSGKTLHFPPIIMIVSGIRPDWSDWSDTSLL